MNRLKWVDREIESLDPVKDCARITHLSFEVKLGSPFFLYGLYSMAFAKQVAVPEIAQVIHRKGRGLILKNTRKRQEDTLIFFGLMFRYLGTKQGEKIVSHVKKVHSVFDIPNDLSLYTLGTLVVLPSQVSQYLLGREILSDKEKIAYYHFWRRVGEGMGVTDFPGSWDEYMLWFNQFEADRFGTTPEGIEVDRVMAQDFVDMWFPKPLHKFGKAFYYGLYNDHLRQTLELPSPNAATKILVDKVVRAFFFKVKYFPDRKDISLIEMFGKRYGDNFSLTKLGPQGDYV